MMISKINNAVRRGWLPITVAFVLGLSLLVGSPAWAANDYQTVPLPTPDDTPEPPPQATPTPDRDDSSDDDDDDDTDGGDVGGGGNAGTTADVQNLDIDPSNLTGVVNAVRLNVRSGPGTDFDVIGTVQAGDQLDLVARDASGTWWLICCSSEGGDGWVSSQFIDANGLARAEANALLPQSAAETDDTAASDSAVESATDSATDSATETDTSTSPAGDDAVEPLLGLVLTVEQSPELVRQGDTFTLRYQLDNPGSEAAVNVMLRSEVPAGLTLVGVDAAGAEQAETPLESGATAILIVWTEVDAGASVAADVTFAVDDDVPNGRVIDVITAGDADNAESTSAGMSVGMPPAALPSF